MGGNEFPGGQGGSRGRVLVVEDDPDTARFITHVLGSRAGFGVVHEPGPVTALARAGAERWDVVITDIAMPDLSGLELLEQLRRQAPGLPVLVITSYASEANRLRAQRGRADEFLPKPLRPDSLAATVTGLADCGKAGRGRAGGEVVLAVGAHPGDVEIGAAGTLLAHRAAGHEVAILTMSQDAAGAGESREAAGIIGAELYLEELGSARVSEPGPAISAIREVIAAIGPTALYTHSAHDGDPGRRGTHRAALAAAPEAACARCFQSPSATVDFRPERFTDVGEQLAGKLAAVGAFVSQAARQCQEPELIEATARYWSRFGAGRYAEAFEVVREPSANPASPEPRG